jgi:hypothetical protein
VASGGTTGGAGGSATGGSSGARDGSADVAFVYDGSGGAGGLTQDSACATASAEGKLERQPADIIFAVDNSGSMTLEASQVQQNMNVFSSQIVNSGIDVRVVLLSSPSGASNGICVPAPLGSGSCPGDSKAPSYLHVPLEIGSHDALNKIISSYSQWRSMLRTNASKAFVVVTDDNATDGPNNSAAAFINSVNMLDPAMFQPGRWKFHSIFAYTGPGAFGTPCFDITFQKAAAEGTVYRELVAQTSGVSGDLCLQNFQPVFNQLATSVVTGSQLSCDIPMPTTNAGVIDPAQVRIEFTPQPGAPAQQINRVNDASQCGNGGWYYDNFNNPTKLILCPSTCNTVKGFAAARISVLLGCLGS